MIESICSNKETLSGVAMAVLMVVEFWLGKTKKVESNSTLELILNGLKLIFKKGKTNGSV